MEGSKRDKTHKFLYWLQSQGAFVHESLNLFAPLPNGDRGLVAKSAIKRDTQLLLIPKALCIHFPLAGSSSPSLAASGAAGAVLAARDPRPSPFMSTVLLLMAEKALGGASSYAPYVGLLPTATDALLAWSEAELAELKGTLLEHKAAEKCAAVYEREVLPIIQPHPDIWPQGSCDADAFEWAAGMVQSRAFHLVSDNWLTGTHTEGVDQFLIPAIDMLNHATLAEQRSTELRLVNAPLTVSCGEPEREITLDGYFTMVAGRQALAPQSQSPRIFI